MNPASPERSRRNDLAFDTVACLPGLLVPR